MNKIERMKAVFAGKAPDYTPAGFWFHYPADWGAEETAEAHLKLYKQLDNDIIKLMDDTFSYQITKDVKIEKASDWRSIKLPGRDCAQYKKMETVIRIIKEKTNGEVMIFPTMWSPFKLASFTYIFANGRTDDDFMADCAADPESVLEGIRIITEAMVDWVEGFLAAGASGIYYSGQFSEPKRFDKETWEKLVKPSDLKVLGRVKELGGYNILHICGEAEHGFESSPARYVGYPGDLINWDVHRTGLSLEEGKKLFNAPILGGLDNHGLLIEGTLEEIAAETKRVIAMMGREGFMLGADCTVPGTIEIERLQTAVNAAKA